MSRRVHHTMIALIGLIGQRCAGKTVQSDGLMEVSEIVWR